MQDNNVEMKTVLSEVRGGVVWITLNRPDQGNSINLTLAKDLFDAVRQASLDSSVHCVVLSAAGKLFCAGGDIAGFGSDAAKFPENIGALARGLHESIEVLEGMDKPLVTVVQGTAAGAGLVLSALGDIVLASDKAKFVPAYGSIGLTPDGGSTWILPRLLGQRRAMEMLLTGTALTAKEAESAGLVTRIVPHDELNSEAEKVSKRLAEGPAWALGRTRRLVREGSESELHAHLEREASSIAEASSKPFAQAAVSNFLNKTK
ncbi:enoyl-CoA hydratase/isomerase family protein [Sulfitobacter dubius]|uniref:enoyl-CoA hydratase/isomerase family protein n=1 Tax=Sulfitobacter dubius TaxID=218673 RepID=UPI0022B04EC3|nr:enoyl-CoA hydratase-related protein [Sulfitobacter dubius]MCZ4366300.1 enoyl-CoA hydratase-related protein [Sulfitobacter dubius]